MRLVSLLWLLPMSCGGSSCGPLNYRAEFGSSPAPSKIDVDPKFIKDTVTKVALTRFPVELKGIPTFEDCPSIENATPVRDYWITSYNWSDIQDELNAKYNVVSALSTFWVTKPTEGDRAAVANHTAPQGAINYISLIDYYVYYGSRYRYIQQSKPLQLAYGLGNSPLGHAMWMYEIMAGLVTTPNYWTLKDIITWSMTYYIPGPYAGFRLYKLGLQEALSEFPGDVTAGLPLSWAQRDGNVVVRYSHPQGGHFPATEVPDLLLADVWTYFGNKNLSNTAVFSEHARSVTGNAHLG
ncbi:hypothetical protein AnigIFM62618_006939 [Aspergillus niger]|nr:hypothetical protein AnigIFM62618_006939 [Aspergillus niger]